MSKDTECVFNTGVLCERQKECGTCGWNSEVKERRKLEVLQEAQMKRTFELKQIKCVLDEGAILPVRAHEDDAGIDLFSPAAYAVPAGGSCVIDTGVHVELPIGTCGLLVSKSGLNVKYDITSTGLIDSGYTGSITVKLYNHGKKIYHVAKGDKVSQLVILRFVDLRPVEAQHITGGERGNAGFGSTGR